MRSTLKLMVLSTALVTQSISPLMAQTRPAPQDRPVTLPRPVPDRPVPLPGPIVDRPVPLPQPVPGRPRPPRPNPGYPGPGYGQGYAGTIACESRNNRTRTCSVNTQNRVALVRTNGGVCNQGRGWGYDRRSIWVRNCRAQFAYGYGNNWGGGGGWRPERPDRDKGPSTGLIIGGVAVAAGLIALLASKNKKPNDPAPEAPTSYPPGPPAALSADLTLVRSEARPSLQTCLFEASRQIGVTGGTRLRLDRITSIEPGNGGWRFAADLTASYPDGDRTTPFYCRATPTKVVQLDFTS